MISNCPITKQTYPLSHYWSEKWKLKLHWYHYVYIEIANVWSPNKCHSFWWYQALELSCSYLGGCKLVYPLWRWFGTPSNVVLT